MARRGRGGTPRGAASRSRPIRDAVRAAVLVFLAACAFVAQGAPRIGVATMQPGEIFFERFGHNAVVVDDPAVAGGPTSYNFGFFDLDEPGFFPRFVRGDMRYMLVALPLEDDLAYYREVGRGVSVQWLDIDPAAATSLAAALELNARPENARYRYDYFTDNCSTRVRDAIDRATGGALRRQLSTRSQGNSFRSEAVRLASPATWMWLGFDLGLGPAADRVNSGWEDAFVPMRLADGLRNARRTDGRPLVVAEAVLLPHRLAPEPAPEARAWWPWLLAGATIGAGLAALARRRPRLAAAVAAAWWTLAGLAGLLMLFLWLGTEHRFAWANRNLLLLSPLALGLVPGAVRIARGGAGGRVFRWLLVATVALAALAPFLLWLPAAPQRNAHWIALLLPLQLAWAVALPRATRPRSPGA